jgi:two-component system phosphate regulon sensor histidine kinase PhoR
MTGKEQQPDYNALVDYYSLHNTVSGVNGHKPVTFYKDGPDLGLTEKQLSTVTHDVRALLTVVRGCIELAEEYYQDGSDEDARRTLGVAVKNLDGSVEILELLSQCCSLPESRSELQFEPITLATFVSSVATRYLPVAEKEGVDLDIQVESNIFILGSRLHLERLVGNLVSNAIKFTACVKRDAHQGRVSVELTTDVESGQPVLRISDNGIGINGSIENLFKYGIRAPNAKAVDGLGLGLYIVKRIADLHDCRISVESEEGVGTTFTITFPVQEDLEAVA